MGAGTGTLTFLFTDLEGSTRAWEAAPEEMARALAEHDVALRAVVERFSGQVVKSTGDGLLAAFPDAASAVRAAIEAQRFLRSDRGRGLRARMGLHTGTSVERDGDHFGPALNRAARIMAVAHADQVLASGACAALAGADLDADVHLVDLGEHQLKDLASPERIFQVTAADLPDEFPPVRSELATSTNLVPPLTTFVGRDQVRTELAQQVTAHRLVTVTGVGGMGKTRLATEVGRDLTSAFPDGVWLCELATAGDGAAVDELISVVLGIRPDATGSAWPAVVHQLRTKRALLILDNCEHLLDPVAERIEALLESCRAVHVLATSREVLSLPGEQVFGVRPLSTPAPGARPEEVEASEAVQLFAERARAADPGFRLAGSEEVVAEICRRLDGIPLAVELAAARTLSLDVADIARMLDERFRLLTAGRRSVERHQTLQAAVDWSYSLLGQTERAVFDRLSAFAGPFSIDAAVAVAGRELGRWDVIEALHALVAKSMAVRDEASPTTRFRLLETMRQYGAGHLAAQGETDEVRRAHAAFYAEFAEAQGRRLIGPEEAAAREAVLEQWDDLRTAVTWALDGSDPDAELGLRIVAGLALLVTSARSSGFWTWTGDAARRVEATSDPAVRAAVLGAASFRAGNYLGDPEEARRLGEAALREGIPDDCPAAALAASAAAVAITGSGRFGEGADRLREQIEELEAHGHDWGAANLRAVRVIFLVIAGRSEEARHEVAAAMGAARKVGSPTLLVVATYAEGMAHLHDDPDRALGAFEESLALVADGASDIVYAETLEQVARLRLRRGDLAEAVDALAEGLRFAADIGNRWIYTACLWHGLEVFEAVGAHDLVAMAAGLSGPGGSLVPVEMQTDDPSAARARDEVCRRARLELGADRYDELEVAAERLSFEAAVPRVSEALDGLRRRLTSPERA